MMLTEVPARARSSASRGVTASTATGAATRAGVGADALAGAGGSAGGAELDARCPDTRPSSSAAEHALFTTTRNHFAVAIGLGLCMCGFIVAFLFAPRFRLPV